MNSTDNNSDKVIPEPSPRRTTTYIAIFIIALMFIISIVTYPFLPDMVPSHWDIHGQIDAYMPKLFNAIFLPAMSLGIYLLVGFLYRIGPRLGDQNPRYNWEIINLIMVGVLLVMLIIHAAILALSLQFPVDITLVMSLTLSGMLIFIGNFMVKLRRNFWGGIRTPWTLSSDIVWERTHRLGGWLFVGGGFLSFITTFFVPPLFRAYVVLIVALGVSLISVVYSYFAYQRYVVNEKRPLSPPFDTGEGGA